MRLKEEPLEAQNRVARLQEELTRVQLRNARLEPWVALAVVLLILTWLLTR